MADRIDIGGANFRRVFEARDGLVGRDLDRRAALVQRAAIAQSGLRTGALKADIHREWVPSRPGRLTIRIGSNVKHALVHHEGADPHVIRARNVRVLRYINKHGQVVFAQSVNHPGHRANKYLTDNLRLAV